MEKNDVLAELRNAYGRDLEDYLTAILNRKMELFPKWDILCISLPKYNSDKRLMVLMNMIDHLAEKKRPKRFLRDISIVTALGIGVADLAELYALRDRVGDRIEELEEAGEDEEQDDYLVD